MADDMLPVYHDLSYRNVVTRRPRSAVTWPERPSVARVWHGGHFKFRFPLAVMALSRSKSVERAKGIEPS